jgi:hypothetical protein
LEASIGACAITSPRYCGSRCQHREQPIRTPDRPPHTSHHRSASVHRHDQSRSSAPPGETGQMTPRVRGG